MSKIRRIFETTQEINFNSPQKEFSMYWNSFLISELGKVYQAIPWKELLKQLKLRESFQISSKQVWHKIENRWRILYVIKN